MSRYDLDNAAIDALLEGQPGFRTKQLVEGLYRHLLDPKDLTNLPISLRNDLAAQREFSPALRPVTESVADGGETVKWLYSLDDGSTIETVLMHHARHSTVCVSSQAGCAMACTFCATGQSGFTRQLSTGEIIEQVILAARTAQASDRRLDHVVFMGMGEPFANFERVWRAVERIVGDIGLAARHVTISTVGLIPQIRLLGERPLQVNLAVSLHAANNTLRNELVPINRRYPIEDLVASLESYTERTHRRISFEWALIDGVNDRDRDVAELAQIAFRLHAHVNVIPLNPTAGGLARGLRGSPSSRIREFRDGLSALGVNVTVRRTRGREIDAACGQLAGSTPLPHPTAKHDSHAVRSTGDQS